MIADLKPYPKMKDSGVEWLGEVPEHWGVRRNGSLYTQRNETGFSELPILEVSLRTGVNIRDFSNSDRKQVMSDREKYKRALKGDIAYNMMRMWQGAVGVSPVDGLISPAYVVAKPRNGVNTKYFERLFRVPAYLQEADNCSRGIVKDRNRLYWEYFKAMPVCVPPLPEQTAIVRYLDYMDRRIRKLIAAKRKLIALLNEQKQVIIHRAVTRGLDPNVPLKDSGVEWLGKVPEHWEVKRNGQIFIQRNETGFPMLPILEVSLRTGVSVRDFENTTRKQVMTDREKYKRAVKGDIAYNMMRMWQGAIGIAPVDGLVSPAYIVAKPRKETEARYFTSLFQTTVYKQEVENYSRGIVKDRNRLYWEDFKTIPTCYPPYREQVVISEYIGQVEKDTSSLTSDAARQITLLTEYRTRLISDVVTGKLDVREAAASLPEVDPLAEDDDRYESDDENDNEQNDDESDE